MRRRGWPSVARATPSLRPASPGTVSSRLSLPSHLDCRGAGSFASEGYLKAPSRWEWKLGHDLVRGIRRSIGAAPKRKAPAVAEIMRDMARTVPAGLKGLRDRALLLLGFGGAFRRSELVALDVADIEFTDDGLRVTIRRSKTDQEGHGATIAVIRG